MRILWQEARDRIHQALATAGYDDIRAEHLAVLQYPGPDGERPSTLAARARMSRQAINHLIGHLERAGYLERRAEGNARVVRLTPRGRKAIRRIEAAVAELEREWASDVGARRMDELRATVTQLSQRSASAASADSSTASGAAPASSTRKRSGSAAASES
jgi:DNA-binding MarR family transcriptional regulator